MAINFYPNRKQMIREVDQCVASNMLDVLVFFCKCCIYKVFDESILVSDCHGCGVREGISHLSRKV